MTQQGSGPLHSAPLKPVKSKAPAPLFYLCVAVTDKGRQSRSHQTAITMVTASLLPEHRSDHSFTNSPSFKFYGRLQGHLPAKKGLKRDKQHVKMAEQLVISVNPTVADCPMG